MIDAKVAGEHHTQTTETPKTITTTMIIEDLDNGIDREGIRTKYNLEKWEVTQMFQHPTLKGRKAKKVKKLSFEFVDDTVDHNQTTIPMPDGSTIDELDAAEPAVEASMEMEDETEDFQGERLREAGISQDEYENGDPYDEGSREWC